MALEFKVNGNILEVKEILMGLWDTRITYWYYDTTEWKKSIFGRKNDKPSIPMMDSEIAWVRKHYLPRVESADSGAVCEELFA